MKSDQFAIQALIPEGSPEYTANQLDKAEAPRLAMMIQNLLADRFKLALHRENREVPVYALTVAKGGPKLHYEEGNAIPRRLLRHHGRAKSVSVLRVSGASRVGG